MDLRLATEEDLDLVVSLGMKFINKTNYDKFADEEYIRGLANSLINSNENEKIIILYQDIGMIVGSIAPFMFGPYKAAHELAWWVEPDERGKKAGEELLNAFEYWAKENDCAFVVMISLDDKLGKYYEKKGYSLYERAYLKEF